jgi:hypothetical protein
MTQVYAEVKVEDTFNAVLDRIARQAQRGMESLAKDVIAASRESMPLRGRTPKDPDYAHAPAGKPPYRHTGRLSRSLAYAVDGMRLVFGTRYSIVGERGAWLEYGGRPKPDGSKSSWTPKRKLNPHPFIGPESPAMKAYADSFVPRVAGSFTT